MKKIVRLTESDLTRIVRRIINEQSSYTVKSGDNLTDISKKFGVNVNTIAKTNNIKDINKIRVGQIIQIPKKSTTQVAKSDSTNLDKYNKYLTKYDTTDARDTTAPYEDEAKKRAKAIEIIKKMTVDEGLSRKVPLHVRAFMQYLLGRTSAWTEKDFTQSERESLKAFMLEYEKNKKKYMDYDFWISVGAGNTPTAMSPDRIKKEFKRQGDVGVSNLINTNMASRFKYFFGQIGAGNIKYDKKTGVFRIIDNYDMNVVERGKSAKSVIDDTVESIKMYAQGEGTSYGVIRNLASWRELAGYKGYPVNVTLT